MERIENLTSACCRTGFPLCSKPAANAVYMDSPVRQASSKRIEFGLDCRSTFGLLLTHVMALMTLRGCSA